jgi:hypothetical protein
MQTLFTVWRQPSCLVRWSTQELRCAVARLVHQQFQRYRALKNASFIPGIVYWAIKVDPCVHNQRGYQLSSNRSSYTVSLKTRATVQYYGPVRQWAYFHVLYRLSAASSGFEGRIYV